MMAAAQKSPVDASLLEDATREPMVMAPTDTLRQAATAMARSKLTHFPVVDAAGKFVGLVTIEDLLMGRSQEARREGERERVLRVRWPFGRKT